MEYALRLPGSRYLPIDSKWTSVGVLERLDAEVQPQERKRLVDQVVRDVRGRIKEMTKYLDPERTLSLGLLRFGRGDNAPPRPMTTGIARVYWSCRTPSPLPTCSRCL